MTSHHLMTPDGTVILPGTMLHATKGVHAGTHWRLEKIVRHGAEHVLRVSRYVRKVGRVFEHLHPSIFGLDLVEVTRQIRIGGADLVRCWRKIDDGLLMGVLALVPLGVFEALHGSEHFRLFLESIFGG